ncbi:DUF917 domain-containing protein [Lipingzhangella sp. LS1_29]|uniref:DUF917 domain-containing protein n=1 Tax=Lipingzhangella rawalii TaxID=2055835 RepID=A0ABU2H7T7_9ACTN|nr:DUF917 domain-containing protein [Lipingzhangella rawalii]MDS1271362.1 DUF917 domain-containing protein [Lipingzhangella rawalii]
MNRTSHTTTDGADNAPVTLDAETLVDYARGAAILGAGGGGATRVGLLAALQAIETHGPVDVISVDQVPEESLVLPAAGLGSPDITQEKIGNPEQGRWLREMMEQETGRTAHAFMATEVGGSNALLPVVWAALTGLPLVDADGMGRAFPEAQMVSMHLADIPATPSAVVDERGHRFMLRDMDAYWLERSARALAVACGGFVCTVDHPMTGHELRTGAIAGSVTRAVEIGRAVSAATTEQSATGTEPASGQSATEQGRLGAVLRHLSGHLLITGKVTDIERRTVDGFVRGHLTVDGLGADQGRRVGVAIQNENLVVTENERTLACVPDIITVLDTQTSEVIFTELLRYGQRVSLLAVPAPDIWRTPRGLEVAGPRAFGFDLDYQPVDELLAEAHR